MMLNLKTMAWTPLPVSDEVKIRRELVAEAPADDADPLLTHLK